MRPPLSPLPMLDPPDPVRDALSPELLALLARAQEAADAPPPALRDRLARRVAGSAAAAAPMQTVRADRTPFTPAAPGVRVLVLHTHDAARPLRPGEPLAARLIELAPGSQWNGPDAGVHHEWLVLRGTATVGGETLAERDFHVVPAGQPARPVASAEGALLFLRESPLPAQPGDQPLTVRDAGAPWPDYGPGIRRRVLWTRDGEAAMLYYTDPGAMVPNHSHGHDEECLMVQGELYLDDVLLRAGDYQLAPAGTGHRLTETDTGVVIYAHGDLDLQFIG